MLFKKTVIEGLYVVDHTVSYDVRGSFSKNFQKSMFIENNLKCDFSEGYYTSSKKNVIRGMHFQSPPHDHEKLVTVISGAIIDVVLDVRKSSKTYGAYFSIHLSSEDGRSLYIPKGLAHGFGVLSENAVTQYLVASEYNAPNDNGVLFNSFGFSWPINSPIISERDLTFPLLKQLASPFK
jgi:dTDP-4-dehydrorhamnose 3,5-epimerase